MRPPAAMKTVLSRDQLRLYKLIWERFVASQMAPAILDTVTVDLVNGDVRFRANGSQVKFPGFMKVYVEGMTIKKRKRIGFYRRLEEGSK